MGFADDTAVTRTGDDRFTATISRRWWIVNGPNGGYLAAIVLRALEARVDDPERRPRSLTIHYLAPPAEGPVSIETRVERAGRSLVSLSARVVQDERTVALALAAFSLPRAGLSFNDLRMPEVPPPDALTRREYVEGLMPPMSGQMATWQGLGALPFTGSDDPTTGGWMRLAEPEPLDHPQLALLTDAWMPAVFNRMSGPGAAPTIDLTIHFREPIPTGLAPDACFLGVFRTNVGADGFVEEDGEIWSADGHLLAQSRQLALGLPA